ncbi:MAG: BadF/BadG/BcrA/BcrD ATPase family protein [Bacteroidota bacterium]
MTKGTYIIGIDGGGSKTHAMIADRKGTIIAEHFAGPSNFQIIGIEKAAETIVALIDMCCDSVECTVKNVASVVCGLAGAGRSEDQKRMAAGLKKCTAAKKMVLKNIVIDSDARIALEGSFKGGMGIILIAGTGSIAFAKDARGTIHRVGGWGRVLGDEGSGYALGRMGLTAVARQLDGRGEKTVLSSMIAKQFGLSGQTEIIQSVYQNSFDVASIAPLVLRAAEKKDTVCRAIVENAVIELAWHIQVAAEHLSSASSKKVKEKIRVAFIGGLIANDTILSRMLTAYLDENFPVIEIAQPAASPAYGAIVLGLSKLK